ncbi:hypothetical protein ACHAWX_006562 [Stephanocyclus meneghinianus]
MENDCKEHESIPASSFAAAAASLVLDQNPGHDVPDEYSSVIQITEASMDRKSDLHHGGEYTSSDGGRFPRREMDREPNAGMGSHLQEETPTSVDDNPSRYESDASAESNTISQTLSLKAPEAVQNIQLITEDNGRANDPQWHVEIFRDSYFERNQATSTEGVGELTSSEQHRHSSDNEIATNMHSDITHGNENKQISLGGISTNNNDGEFLNDSILSNSISVSHQQLDSSNEDMQVREETGSHVNNLCPNHPLSPSSYESSSSTFMPSTKTLTKQEPPPKSIGTEQSSLLFRGVSLLGKQFTPSRAISNRNVSSSARAKYDTDASSVISDLSHDVKSVKSSMTLPTSATVNQRLREDAEKEHLEESGLILVKRLVEFLSECPLAPEEEEIQRAVDGRVKSTEASPLHTEKPKKARGLTLPASAIGWISHQLNYCDDTTIQNLSCDNPSSEYFNCYQVPKQQLQCLHTLLRRVTSLRVTNDKWPPPLPPTVSEAAAMAKKKAFSSIPETGAMSSKLLSKFTDQSSVMDHKSADDDSGSTGSSKDIQLTSFQRFFHELQYNPNVDMRLFPHASNVVNLDMFQMEKGCLLDINQLFFPSDFYGCEGAPVGMEESGLDQEAPAACVYSALTKLRLSNCAMSEAAGLRGRRVSKMSDHHSTQLIDSNISILPKRIPTLSRFPKLVSLNLSHNELFRTKTALAGLSSLPFLSSINLSYNRLSNMKDVFMHIGNVKELILSGNEITSSQGLDRLFSLERLSLDQNKIQHLATISGLAKLPFLTNFDLKGNPLEIADPESCRIEVFNLFREVRCKSMPKNATYRDMQQLLPVLDSVLATKDELVAIKNLTFRQTVGSLEAIDYIDTGMTDNNEIKVDVSGQNKGRRVTKMSTSRTVHCRIARSFLNDDNLRERKLFYERVDDQILDAKVNEFPVQYKLEEIITSIRPNIDLSDQSIVNDTQTYQRSRTQSSFSQCKLDNVPSEKSDTPFRYSLPASLLVEADGDVWNPVPVCVTLPDYELSDHENEILTHIDSSVVLHESESPELSSPLSYDEDYVPSTDVAGGVSDVYFKNMYSDAVSDHEPPESTHELDELTTTKSMFEGIWEQTYRDNVASVPDASGSATSTKPTAIDYNSEELNAVYDGPPDYSSISVASDLDLYFDTYVFPGKSSGKDSQEEASRKEVLVTPRIQLFKFDRDSLVERSKNHGDLIERYIGVWRENILACGSYARARLNPIKMLKRSFHGDNVTKSGKDVFVSKSRKVVVCLSSSAIYFIVDDDVTLNQNTPTNVKRAFPSKIPSGATFGDAYWAHALIRHSLECLAGITIGFQFQRLLLRFSVSNASGLSLEYSYVLLTSNKLQTISLLQKLQSHVNDVQQNSGQRHAILIENDDKVFLDSLGARTDEVVIHYQILHQCWKRGDRAAARRSFVLTDSTIYLLDETYNGDGSTHDKSTKRLGDISLDVIDSANLNRVTEIRAANEDPRMITLVILPFNKLKRAHRWRLVCNDGEGAERLIDDVRKTMRSKT